MKLTELLLEAVEGRQVGALDRRVTAGLLLAGGVLLLRLRARRTARARL